MTSDEEKHTYGYCKRNDFLLMSLTTPLSERIRRNFLIGVRSGRIQKKKKKTLDF